MAEAKLGWARDIVTKLVRVIRELSDVRKQKYRGCCQAWCLGQAKCLSFPRKVSSVIVMTQLSHVKTDWTPADAKTPIIFHFLKNKFLSENHQLLVKMNMHQWYILHKYTVRGVWPWTSRKFFTPTICLMPAHSLSLNVEVGPGGSRQSDHRRHFPVSSVTGKPVCHWPWRQSTRCCRVTRVANIDWRVAAHFSSQHVQHNFRIALSRCSLNLDDPHCWLVQVIRIFTPTVGLELLSVQIKEGVEESEWVPMLRIRAGGWCQIKKGAVRPRADAGTWPWSQLCVECEMSEEELQRARNRIIKIDLTKTEQSRNITVNAELPIVGLEMINILTNREIFVVINKIFWPQPG